MKAKKKKSAYKSDSLWLDAVYRNNKYKIDVAFYGTQASPKSSFKRWVYDIKDEYNITLNQAVKKLSRSEIFLPRAERLRMNILKGIKETGMFTQFRKLSGWKNKIDINKFIYDYNTKSYIYDNRIKIDIKNSPYEVIISTI